jgi:hypothetical protein
VDLVVAVEVVDLVVNVPVPVVPAALLVVRLEKAANNKSSVKEAVLN